MNSPRNTAFMAKLRNNKGFTMIEMAIVLVIIGIILGAVIKGQDLIESGKAKQFTSKLKAWEISLSTYYDRKGKFPGDSGKNGIIGDGGAAELAAFTDISTAQLVSPPEKSFQLGGSQFYVVAGSDSTSKKNYLLVCKTIDCTGSAFSPGDANDLAALKFFEAFDTSIDGTADATLGTVTGATAVTASSDGSTVPNYKATVVTVGAGDADWIKTTNIKALAYHLK